MYSTITNFGLIKAKGILVVFLSFVGMLIITSVTLAQLTDTKSIPFEAIAADDPLNLECVHPYIDVLKQKRSFKIEQPFQDPYLADLSLSLGNDEWTTNGPYGGGLFYSLAIAPGDSNIMYAGSYGIGLYKSNDGGTTWSLLETIDMPYIYAIAIDPDNSDIVYASSYNEIYKSTDGGQTWHQKTNGISGLNFRFGLIIDPSNTDVLYLATRNNIFKTVDGGDNWESVLGGAEWVNILTFDPNNSSTVYAGDRNGVWKTKDGGTNWSFSRDGFPDYPWIYGLAVDPSNPDIVYAGTQGLYRSEDGGNNWSLFGLEGKRIYWGLKIDPSDPNRIFVGTSSEGFFRTLDGGNIWEHITSGIPVLDVYGVELNPQNYSTLYCETYCGGIFRSWNKGESWLEVDVKSRNLTNTVAMASDNSDIVYASANYAGIFKSSDLGNSWTRKNKGLDYPRANSVIVNPQNSSIVYCTDSANIYKSIDGGENWQTINTGLENVWWNYSLTIAPSNPNVIFAGTNNGIFRTENAGDNWEIIAITEVSEISGPVAVHPNSPDTIFVGVYDAGIYRTTDGGINWELIFNGQANINPRDIEIDPSHPDIVYASIPPMGVFKSYDKGDNWQYAGLAGYNITALEVDPDNSNIVYTGCWDSNKSPGGVYLSINGGENWAAMNQGLKTTQINTLVINPNDHYHIFVGTSNYGVWDYTIQNYPPIVEITEPQKRFFEYGKPITFICYGVDQEEGELPDSVLVWTSSLQGELGIGDTLTVDSLNSGDQVISLTGKDSFGASNQDSITIKILPQGISLIAALEAETDMTAIANSHSPDGAVGWILLSNGSLVSNEAVHFPERRVYNFDLIAKGWECKGWPLCDLNINGNIGAKNIKIDSSDYSEFNVQAIVDSGDFKVEIAFTNDLSIPYEGDRNFALDKIVITSLPLLEHDIAVQYIITPEVNINPTASVIPKAQISNLGSTTETNFDVTCTIDKIDTLTTQEVYRSTQTIATLVNFEQMEVSFEPFTPPEDGRYLFTFFHDLIGDENTINDSLAIEVRTAIFEDASQFADVADAGNGFGAAVGDYDLDGYLDIYHTKNGNNVLFHNNQNGTFGDRAPDEGLEDYDRNSRTAGWFDYDNDGDPDLIVLNNEGIALYRNDNGSFADVSSQAGFGGEQNVMGLAIGDYNNDSFLDVYAARYDMSNFFYSNNGDGSFSNITNKTRLWELGENSSSALFWDFDIDGDQDLLVVNHTENHHLFRNNADTTFTEVAEQVGIPGGGNGHNALVFDYNNDGYIDLYIINSQPNAQENILYRNNGGVFTNVTEEAGAGDAGDGTGGAYGDFDYDGYVDFYVVNADGPNLLYHNNGDGTFTNIAYEAGVDNQNNGHGTVMTDFDNDGDIDIYLVNNGQENALYYNTGTNNNWLHVKTVGKLSNRDGMGVVIELVANGQRFTRLVDGNPGYGSQSSLIAEFGLGQAATVDSLIIRWPSGIVQDTTNVAVNQKITITESILAHDLAALEILSPITKATVGVPVTPQVLIKNTGANEEINFDVVCVVDTGGIEIFRNEQKVEHLAILNEKKISFSEFIPTQIGDFQFNFFTDLTNDQQRANDTLSITVNVSKFAFFMDVADEVDLRGNDGGPAVACGDYNNDNYLDIYSADYGDNANFYQNNGDGTFADVTRSARLEVFNEATACAFADYDNDGYLDLCVTGETSNTLYHNSGHNTFRNVTHSAGIGSVECGTRVAFGDYNNDGLLDIYIANDCGQSNNLYKNNGNGTFTDVADAVGMGQAQSSAGITFIDYDNDGDLDIFVANGNGVDPFALYRNNGNETFTDVASQAGIDKMANARNVDLGDYNNDGYLDLFVTVTAPGESQILLHNNGNGTFTDVTQIAGIDNLNIFGNSVIFLDYDYDGYLDIYIVDNNNDRLYLNNGDGTFTDISEDAGISENYNGWGATAGDYDNDGDIDIYVTNSEKNFLYQHQGTPNNWLIVKTVGTISNSDGIGARVRVVSEILSQIREVNGGTGACQNSLPVEFGLGQDSIVDSLIIRWPSGIVQDTTNVAVNQFITIVEDSTLVNVDDPRKQSSKIPKSFQLSQNYPNPFNPITTIKFALPKSSHTNITIHNMLGQEILTLVDEKFQAGHHQIVWDASEFSSGIYLCKMECEEENIVLINKMLLLK